MASTKGKRRRVLAAGPAREPACRGTVAPKETPVLSVASKGEPHLSRKRSKERRSTARVGVAVATAMLCAGVASTTPAAAAAIVPDVHRVTHQLPLLAHPTPPSKAQQATPTPSPVRPDGSPTVSVESSDTSWTVVLVYVLVGLWMLVCGGIITWLAIARRRDSA